MRKVRVGSQYIYRPVMIDKVDKPFNIKPGDTVKVVNLPGCPSANIMGHCHVNHLDGTFAGLVCVNSLKKQGEEL